jgi:phosphoglycolate phosphatase
VVCALEFLRADPKTAIMIGDHPMDINTGKAAGILTAGVCSGSASRSELLAAGPDWIAEDCEALIEELVFCDSPIHRLTSSSSSHRPFSY